MKPLGQQKKDDTAKAENTAAPAAKAASNFFTAVLYSDFIILFCKVLVSITLTLFIADLMFGIY